MKKRLTKTIITLFFSGLMVFSAAAQTAEEALEVVKKSTAIVLADLKANKAKYQSEPAALNHLIDTKMLPYFDAEAMARLVLARNWQEATPEQKKEFLDEFKQLLMRTYSSSLLDYTDATVRYGKPTPLNRNRTKIDVTVTNADGSVYPLTLSMGYREGKWRGYDVAMDGLSVITSYRGSLGEEIEQKGLQAVIDEIKQKNAQGAVIDNK